MSSARDWVTAMAPVVAGLDTPPHITMNATRTPLSRAALCLFAGLLASMSAGCKFIASQLVDHREAFASGMPKSQGSLAGGVQTGDWTFYYESGKPRAKGRYANDRMVGPWTFFYESGTVERSGAYDESGKRTGEWTMQYADQAPQARGHYVADNEEGPWVFYGSNGALEREGQFAAGQLSGSWRHYHSNGRLKANGMCHRGQRVGAWEIYDEAGQRSVQDFGGRPGLEVVREKGPSGLRRSGLLVDGVPTGRWTSYHDNGKPQFCCTLTGASASGVYEARDADGNVLAQALIAGNLPSAPFDGPALLAALTKPVDRTLAWTPEPAAAPAAAPATAAVVAAITAEPERVPAAAQPDLTVKQKKEMTGYVREYTEGPAAAGGSLFDSYRPAGAPARSVSQGEQKQWYGKPLPFTVMKGVDGQDLDLTQCRGKRVMLVVLRGFLGEVCVYCIAQTKALSQQQDRLAQLGVEVLVVYPGAKENQRSFQQAYQLTFSEGSPPYRVFYDPDLELVGKLGIAGDLASPSTVIVGKDGNIEFFYRGEHKADRPAAKRLLQIIEGLQK
jgi:antitoxin component YwqK of YwqJK toxin-antitoxin module/peroxiredoxin